MGRPTRRPWLSMQRRDGKMQMWEKIMKIWGLDRRLLWEVIIGVQWKELQPLFSFADKPRRGKHENVELMTLNMVMLAIIS